MDLMEGQPYSLAFKKEYPKFNGLIWSYHWYQMVIYDALMSGRTRKERQANVAAVVRIFRAMTQNPETLPAVIPMSPAIAPMFSERYPEAAIIFDNLHSMHDVVSDILVNPIIPRDAKRKTILEAAAHYRDGRTMTTSVSDWRDMARGMGVEKMGGRAKFGPIPADSSKSTDRHH